MVNKTRKPKMSSPKSSPGKVELNTDIDKKTLVKASVPVVGIGASAGGLDALKRFFSHLPAKTGMAYVVVTHMAANQESHLVDILSAKTQIPMLAVSDKVVIEPDHVYVLAPGNDVIASDGSLQLVSREDKKIHTPIDRFFQSLAKHSSSAIGVILSGEGSDGAAGVIALKYAGGMVIAQDPNSTEHSAMPLSAINTHAVDLVLPPEEIARELGEFAKHRVLRESPSFKKVVHNEAIGVKDVLSYLKQASGLDFSQYKPSTILRRVQRRMMLCRKQTWEEYLGHLKSTPSEIHLLKEDLLIKVTAFFRDPAAFETLKREVFPKLQERMPKNKPIRIWVVACSTGEEVYSITTALLDFLGTQDANIKVFASDISETAIQIARRGLYPDQIRSDVPEPYLRRFFTKVENGFQINPSVRDCCVFAKQNITADPPFSKIDLISCRNLLIYFDRTLQREVVPIFHYALTSDGFLWLGNAESISGFSQFFRLVDKAAKVHQKKQTQASMALPQLSLAPSTRRFPQQRLQEDPPSEEELIKRADQLILTELVPPAFIVDADLNILKYRGHTGPYLAPNHETPSLNLLKMVRPELRLYLQAAIRRAKTGISVRGEKVITISHSGGSKKVYLDVLPVRSKQKGPKISFVVAIREAKDVQKSEPVSSTETYQSRQQPPAKSTREREREHFELELRESREDLQAVVEEYESTNEDLKSSNEEVLSANEELQSTNEELETAKEELQSTNEELSTVNDELRSRNIELRELSDDYANTLASVKYPMVILGPDLCIRRFTSEAEKLFKLIGSDTGRPITDINPTFHFPKLKEAVQHVMHTLRTENHEVKTPNGRVWSLQIHPYLTNENKIHGSVLVLLDITAHKKAEAAERSAKEFSENIVGTVIDPLLVLNADLRVSMANRSFYKKFGVSKEETIGKHIYELNDHQWDIPDLRRLLEEVLPHGKQVTDFEVTHQFDRMGSRTMLINALELQLEPALRAKNSHQIFMAMKDITERARALRFSQSIIEAAPDAMLLSNRDGNILMVNAQMKQLFGYNSSEIIGKNVEMLIPKALRKEYQQKIGDYIKKPTLRKMGVGVELSGLKKDGREFRMDVGLSPVQTQDELLICASVRDISAQVQIETYLKRLKMDADSANEAKSEFLANMSHEIRTPLTAIIGFSEILANASFSEEQRHDYAARIQNNGKNLQQLIDDILDLSKIEAGKIELEHIRFSFLDEIAEVAALHQVKAKAKGVSLNIDRVGALPRSITSDPTRLRQILNNLIGNAIKFTSEGSVGVRISLGQQRDGNASPRIEFVIKDTGCGIPKVQQKRLFAPFVQADSSVTRKFGGTGLGLVLARKLAQALGGDVQLVESSPGKGSTFLVDFTPDKIWEYSKEAERKALLSGPVITVLEERHKKKFSGIRVLVAEDNPELQQLLVDILKLVGAEVTAVSDGDEAIEVARDKRFDIVFMDIQMPKKSGYEATRELRKGGFEGPVIALTARLMKQESDKCLQVGCDDFLAKPYTFDQIFNIMKRHLKE